MEKPIPDREADFVLIGRFHDFALTEAELQDFSERLEKDPILQERFRIYGEMDQHIDREIATAKDHKAVVADFKNTLQKGEDRPEAKLKPLFSRRLLAMAATITLLLVAGLWWINRTTDFTSGEALAAYYWKDTDKAHLFDASQRGDNQQDPNEPARTFFRSIRDFQAKGDYVNMIDQLEIYKINTPAPIPFEDDADWLLAIAYLANSDFEHAKIQLEHIIENYPLRREKAQQLLDDVRKLESEGVVER